MTETTVAELNGDPTRARVGMWLFLLSEILLFGGMFILYSAYRYRYPLEFHQGSQEMDVLLGTLNTILLQTSALVMTLSVVALQRGNRRL
jgi:cytochrome c oxidase subunit 3